MAAWHKVTIISISKSWALSRDAYQMVGKAKPHDNKLLTLKGDKDLADRQTGLSHTDSFRNQHKRHLISPYQYYRTFSF